MSGRSAVTVAVMLATTMVSLDTTIANVALPHMQGGVSATQDQIAWVLTSYLVATAVMTPLSGWLAGRFGRRRLLLSSIAGFTAVSILCGVAQSLFQLVAFRTAQGLFGASLIPLSQAVLLDAYPQNQHPRAMAIWAAGAMVAPIFGPVIGGWLTDRYSWHWIFFINLPIGLAAFLGVSLFAAADRPDKSRLFDFFGFSTFSLGIAAFQLLLDRGQFKDWFASGEIRIEAMVSAFFLFLFVLHTLTADRSFFNRALLADRNFIMASITAAVVGGLFNASLALLPSMMQTLLGYPAVTTGIAMAPRGLGSLAGFFLISRMIRCFGPRSVLAAGLCLMCLTQWQMSQFALSMDMAPVIRSSFLQGLGIGFSFIPSSTIAFSMLAPALRTEGAAIFNLIRTLGGSVGISLTQTHLVRNTQAFHSLLAEHVRLDNPLAHPPFLLPPFDLSTTTGVARIDAEVTRQASMLAYVADFRTLMLAALASLALLMLMRSPRPK
ncbi:MAG: DHA2 family efflux MFS transporter permease subunit [Telmatospirillum sp.]|nr:DHA2 family efflux MFS transporter permease subunit [Telmatospirillum sp.]